MPSKKYLIKLILESGREIVYIEYTRQEADTLMAIIQDRLNLTPTLEIVNLV